MSSYSLLGGVPTKSVDLIPSLVFGLAFALMAIPFLVRTIQPSSRKTILIRPLLFTLMQSAAFFLRAYISYGPHYSLGLFIASAVLLFAGFAMVIEPTITLLRRTALCHPDKFRSSRRLFMYELGVQSALIAALCLAVFASTEMGEHTNGSDNNVVRWCRIASTAIMAVISLGVITLSSVLIGRGLMTFKQALVLLPTSILLLVNMAYKFYAMAKQPAPLATSSKIEFYALLALPQLLALVPLAAINLKSNFYPPSYTLPLADEEPVPVEYKYGEQDVEAGEVEKYGEENH